METTDPPAPDSSSYTLRPETAELCLSTGRPEPHRKLAYINSLCAFCLAVAVVGFKPNPIVERPLQSPEDPMPIPWEQPDQQATTDSQTPIPQESSGTPETVIRPQIVDVQPALIPGGAPSAVAPIDTGLLLPLQRGPAPTTTAVISREWHPGSHNDTGFYPPPGYPPRARREKMQGVVVLDIVVGEDGLPSRVSVRQSSGHSELDDYTVNWVKSRWRWPAGATRYYFWSCGYELK